MLQIDGYVFKRAEVPHEFEQIHQLNYRTFVSEIPQHADTGNGRLVDKFHEKNSYLIAVRAHRVVGMVSVHDQPPFSVADRLCDPALLFRDGSRPLEVRLLAIEPACRGSTVIVGLLYSVYEYAKARSHSHLLISGIEDRLSMYQHLGFEPLGPAVLCGAARFIPMSVTVNRLAHQCQRKINLWLNHVQRVRGEAEKSGERKITSPEPETLTLALNSALLAHDCSCGSHLGPAPVALMKPRAISDPPICLLPGPVQVSAAVHEAFCQPPIYHRSSEFIRLFEQVRRLLADLAGSRDVAVFNGSGTLANEVVAATLAADTRQRGPGLLLINGEFGERLARQADRFGLRPQVLSWAWGRPWDLEAIEAALADQPEGSWVWGVHQESSTGVLNDLQGLVRLAKARGVRVCVDCISSLGAVPLELKDVYLASGASGKALGAFAGAAIVFADQGLLDNLDVRRIPSCLDLPAALSTSGPRYTFPSPTILALQAALAQYSSPEAAQLRYRHYASLGTYVREQLRQVGLRPLADERWASPVITTFAPPQAEDAENFVELCRDWGFAIGGQSGYLAERGLVQIATMGAVTKEMCSPLFERLTQHIQARSRQAQQQYDHTEPGIQSVGLVLPT